MTSSRSSKSVSVRRRPHRGAGPPGQGSLGRTRATLRGGSFREPRADEAVAGAPDTACALTSHSHSTVLSLPLVRRHRRGRRGVDRPCVHSSWQRVRPASASGTRTRGPATLRPHRSRAGPFKVATGPAIEQAPGPRARALPLMTRLWSLGRQGRCRAPRATHMRRRPSRAIPAHSGWRSRTAPHPRGPERPASREGAAALRRPRSDPSWALIPSAPGRARMAR